jgi:MMP 1-O-methyltransferase
VSLPKSVRRLTPDRIRHSVRLRAVAVGTGLIPPRTMHSAAESAMLGQLAEGRRAAVEIGVYEGSSAVVLCQALPESATLHLIDPFIDDRGLREGQRGTAWASRQAVARARRARGPKVVWHIARSQDVGLRWSERVDLVFIDGDHAEETCRRDWELWSPHVTPGGVVAFHDARLGKHGTDHLPHRGGLPGPTTVVDELFRGLERVDGWRIVAERDTAVAVERL